MTKSNMSFNKPATAVFSWTVKPGKEQLFEQRMHEIHRVARTYPGHMGVTTIKSPGRNDSFQTVLRFDTQAHLETWLHSPARSELMQSIEEVAHKNTAKQATGLETWFTLPSQQTTPPPKWKMALTTFIAIYPVSLLYGIFLYPSIANWPVWARAFVLPVLAPIILTYILMPFLTQVILRRWLYKNARDTQRP